MGRALFALHRQERAAYPIGCSCGLHPSSSLERLHSTAELFVLCAWAVKLGCKLGLNHVLAVPVHLRHPSCSNGSLCSWQWVQWLRHASTCDYIEIDAHIAVIELRKEEVHKIFLNT